MLYTNSSNIYGFWLPSLCLVSLHLLSVVEKGVAVFGCLYE